MTTRETWKGMERKIAKLLGGERTPLSGINSGHTGADIIHPYFFVECKYRKNFAIKKLYDDTVEVMKKEVKKKNKSEKIIMVVIKEKNTHGELVFMKIEDFVKIVKEEYIK